MEKAYDQVEWDFLFDALHKFGFHPKWIELIKPYISTVLYYVIVNENVWGFFTPTRAISQGDLLSPYPFIICMELLTWMLQKTAFRQKCGIGVKISPKASKFSCLLFADDSLLFCRTNLESFYELSYILHNLCHNSRQLINFHKSSLTFSSNAYAYDKQIVSSIFNITHQDNLGQVS